MIWKTGASTYDTYKQINSVLFNSVKYHYLGFIVVEVVTLTDGKHPIMEVGNRPPCLLGGFSVNIDPKSTKI